MKVVVSKSELATEISKAMFVRLPPKIEVDRAVQTSLKNGPTSTVRCHVTQHLDWIATIWIDGIYATGIPTVSKQFGAAFSFYNSTMVGKKPKNLQTIKNKQTNKWYHLIYLFVCF